MGATFFAYRLSDLASDSRYPEVNEGAFQFRFPDDADIICVSTIDSSTCQCGLWFVSYARCRTHAYWVICTPRLASVFEITKANSSCETQRISN